MWKLRLRARKGLARGLGKDKVAARGFSPAPQKATYKRDPQGNVTPPRPRGPLGICQSGEARNTLEK